MERDLSDRLKSYSEVEFERVMVGTAHMKTGQKTVTTMVPYQLPN